MNATELRIGNYVWYECTYHVVTGIDYTGIGRRVWSNWYKALTEEPCIDREAEYSPIELTEELLLKIGFELLMNESEYKYTYTDKRNFEVERRLVSFGRHPKGSIVSHGVNLKYVHQLQNLYYAITGKELEINL